MRRDLKLIFSTVKKPGHWISYQFYHRQEPIKWCHRLTVTKRAYPHVKITQQWKSTFRQERANTVNPPMSPRSKSVQCRLTARSGSMHAYIGLLYTTFALSVWHGQSWANICVVRLVVRLKYKDVHKPHYAFRRTFLSWRNFVSKGQNTSSSQFSKSSVSTDPLVTASDCKAHCQTGRPRTLFLKNSVF